LQSDRNPFRVAILLGLPNAFTKPDIGVMYTFRGVSRLPNEREIVKGRKSHRDNVRKRTVEVGFQFVAFIDELAVLFDVFFRSIEGARHRVEEMGFSNAVAADDHLNIARRFREGLDLEDERYGIELDVDLRRPAIPERVVCQTRAARDDTAKLAYERTFVDVPHQGSPGYLLPRVPADTVPRRRRHR
jgi:hypothetical protein